MRYYSFFLYIHACSVTEEYNLVVNPTYNIISMRCTPQQGMITTSTTVATTAREDAAAIDYEEVSNISDNEPSTPITANQSATDV